MGTAEQEKRGRGRPKGTGIDDRIWLREIIRLMRIDPATTPTGAIKALGITDPSTIRRLRDKHRELGSGQIDSRLESAGPAA